MSISRNLSIDLVKIVAMMCVMVLHIRAMWLNNTNLLSFTMSRAAGMAIPLFFMVSGYLLFGRQPDVRYSLKKIWGILRFVWTLSLGYTLVIMILKHTLSLDELLKALYLPFAQAGSFGVFWYLGAMCIIYTLLPLINRLPTAGGGQNATYQIVIRLLICIFILFVTNSVIYQSNIMYGFEKKVYQMLRVWNWLLYFLIGALFKELNLTKIKISVVCRLIIILITLVLYIIFQKLSIPTKLGIEYFFGSPAHIAFSCIMFIALASINIQSNKVVKWLSNLFLPVYAFHSLVILYLNKLSLLGVDYAGFFTPILNFLLVASITITISAIVMKTPIVKNIFKI